MQSEITNPDHIRDFIFGGQATFTIKGQKTHYTFRVWRGERKFAVYQLNGDYENLIGTVSLDLKYFDQKPNGMLAPWRAFVWYWQHIGHPDATFYHLGRCCVCNRPLTNPESIESGIGPVCKGR